MEIYHKPKAETINIKVNISDLNLMRKECVELFEKAHPETKGVPKSDRFMFERLVRYYLDE